MKKIYEKMKWETNAGKPLVPFLPSRPGRTVEYVKRKRDKKTERDTWTEEIEVESFEGGGFVNPSDFRVSGRLLSFAVKSPGYMYMAVCVYIETDLLASHNM